ncbi:ArsR/SmtB family transcription factor [Paraburkholderia diazotrophica]|uniref:ArsR/SmtB family transcription factor n=1 Tax=Paraburkholderia diazotrophica TaxID=667676 RepID=UPI00316E9FC6
MLVTAGPVCMSAGAIAEALGLPSLTLSYHLKELSYAGLIEGHSQGRRVVYSANYSNMHALVDFLPEKLLCDSTGVEA